MLTCADWTKQKAHEKPIDTKAIQGKMQSLSLKGRPLNVGDAHRTKFGYSDMTKIKPFAETRLDAALAEAVADIALRPAKLLVLIDIELPEAVARP